MGWEGEKEEGGRVTERERERGGKEGGDQRGKKMRVKEEIM